MLQNVERFDMQKLPTRQRLRPLIWTLCLPAVWVRHHKLTKVNMKGIRPPYLLLSNHNAFFDFKVASKAIFPHRANYVVAIDGFIGREKLLRAAGGICKRKFTNDTTLIRNLKRVVDAGDIAVIYPEARYSLCGTTAVMPESLGKLAKFLGVPVVTLCCNGHHINSPFWNTRDRGVKHLSATMTCVANKDEVQKLSAEQIFERICSALSYDDYAWQKQNKIEVKKPWRAEGLHKVLYQCPNCKTEFEMSSKGDTLKCNHCGKEWQMTTLGELVAKTGKTEFSHIPDWYEWERENVKREIESGKYHFENEVQVDALLNAKGYIDLGMAKFMHDKNGFHLAGEYEGEKYEVKIPVSAAYSVHIEYDYLGKKGDCVDLNTLTDTLYCYPTGNKFSVTKISLATEELYKFYCKKK